MGRLDVELGANETLANGAGLEEMIGVGCGLSWGRTEAAQGFAEWGRGDRLALHTI